MTIWKFPIEVEDQQMVSMPQGATILTIQVQHDTPCIWILCDPSQPKQTRRITMYGTGHRVPADPGRYVGSFQLRGGSLVFHVFEP